MNLCEGVNCGVGGNCSDGNCTCKTGYVNVANICVDLCEEINCGVGGICSDGNCTCGTGYVNVANNCEETCVLNPCKELIKTK